MNEQKHRAGLAAVLSFLFNGLGQLYIGKIAQGFVIMGLSTLSMVLIVVGAVFTCHWLITQLYPVSEIIIGAALLAAGIVMAGIVGAYSILHAYRDALK